MKLVVAAGLVALLAHAPTARAQNDAPSSRWTDSEGVWSLDFAANDWVMPERDPRMPDDRELIIVPRVAPADGEGVTVCSAIQAHPHIDPGVDIAQFANSLDAESAAGLLHRSGGDVSSITHTMINGVAVADVAFNNKDDQNLYRIFLAPAASRGLLVLLNCTRTAGANPDNVAAEDRILSSLQINARTPK